MGSEGEMWVWLSADAVTKAGEGGSGPTGMCVPNACADGVFTDVGSGEGSTFVEYLRNTFKWGGFPGWERRKERPQATIDRLAEGLLPL
jgi:hypothetical protein